VNDARATVEADSAQLVLEGRITARTAAPIWRSALATLARNRDRPVVIDASRLEHVDDVGLALLFDLVRQNRLPGAQVELRALAPNLTALVSRYDPVDFAAAGIGSRRHSGVLEQMGRAVTQQLRYVGELAEFLAECVRALRRVLTGRGLVTWRDVLDVATEAGANAVPIVLLMGLLVGVIIAFEIGIVARQFGAVIFVVNGVGVAMLRELGALITAIVLAGRTGAAFAAEIGTQKVNEELNAISTFGLNPIEFLVVPRLIAAVVVVPLLAVLADLVGILGGALVMSTFDINLLQFSTQLLGAVTAGDFFLGVVKAAVFGLTIAAIGCHRGLDTAAGATSVGLSATRAVVTSIVLVVVIDGLFAVFTS
jgi:phospholipid/cholesterol/gamma-HCH transport system permease protein